MMPVHSSARRTSPARSQAVSIEQKESRRRPGADLAGRDRGQGRVEAGESLAHPSLRNQRQAAVGHAPAPRGRSRRTRGRSSTPDRCSPAGHRRRVDRRPCTRARDSPTRRMARPDRAAFGPVLPNPARPRRGRACPRAARARSIATRVCRAELTGIPEKPERRLPVAECIGGSIVHVVQAADDLMGDRQPHRPRARPAPRRVRTRSHPRPAHRALCRATRRPSLPWSGW